METKIIPTCGIDNFPCDDSLLNRACVYYAKPSKTFTIKA